ncbi:MAG: hypothetical protein M3Y69_00790 [Verrucomicrobiota bacterium]|nr:hypothetical protein [Verrucomicrobiota bacterium]
MPDNEGQLTFEQPRSVFSTWIGVVLLFAFFGLLAWAVMGALPRGDQYEPKRAAARVEKLTKAREEWDSAMHRYAWADKEKGLVRVPIERAMELTLADLAQKKPAPAGAIAPADLAQPGVQTTAPVAPTPAAVAPAGVEPTASPKAIETEGPHSENRGQPAAADNPPNAQPGTQPGANATPAASAPPPSNRAQPGPGKPTATPVQKAPGTPNPVPGKKP